MNSAKTRKNQAAQAVSNLNNDSQLNEAMLNLEDVCANLLQTRFAQRDDSERMYWQQRFKNIVTPLSLALAEVRGPRRFHNHYRHDSKDETIMYPVLGNAMDILAKSCIHALEESNVKLSGIHDSDLMLAQRRLEKALNNFLLLYNKKT